MKKVTINLRNCVQKEYEFEGSILLEVSIKDGALLIYDEGTLQRILAPDTWHFVSIETTFESTSKESSPPLLTKKA